MQGLFQRGGMWHARLLVPERFRTLAGRREFVRSTRRREIPAAKLVHAQLMVSWRLYLYKCAGQVFRTQR